jgi:thiamine-phosphate pyrophosphorylase
MIPHLPRPVTYLITSGQLASDATPESEDFKRILRQMQAAVRANVSLVQLREKQLTARTLHYLSECCAAMTRGTRTRLLVNDRADIARATGADGVHLTTRSLPPRVVRESFGADFLIGVSAHNLDEARRARDEGSDFATFSPVYATPSKSHFNLPPTGLEALRRAAADLAPFPLVALGGITRERIGEALRAGATGIAGISLFADDEDLESLVRRVNEEI